MITTIATIACNNSYNNACNFCCLVIVIPTITGVVFEWFAVFLHVHEILCNQTKYLLLVFSTKVVVYNRCILKKDKVGFLLVSSNMFTRLIWWLSHCWMITSDYPNSRTHETKSTSCNWEVLFNNWVIIW